MGMRRASGRSLRSSHGCCQASTAGASGPVAKASVRSHGVGRHRRRKWSVCSGGRAPGPVAKGVSGKVPVITSGIRSQRPAPAERRASAALACSPACCAWSLVAGWNRASGRRAPRFRAHRHGDPSGWQRQTSTPGRSAGTADNHWHFALRQRLARRPSSSNNPVGACITQRLPAGPRRGDRRQVGVLRAAVSSRKWTEAEDSVVGEPASVVAPAQRSDRSGARRVGIGQPANGTPHRVAAALVNHPGRSD